MRATIQPMLVAGIMEVVADIGCRRASFVTRDDALVVMAATPDKSVLIHGSVPATVRKPGGFSLVEDEFNLMRSPSRSQASITFDGYEIARLSYGRRSSAALATPFKGTRHPARRLPDTYDAMAVASTAKLYDAMYKSLDSGRVLFDASKGRMAVNGVKLASIRAKKASASGRYDWGHVACMVNNCQHAKYLTVQITDNGTLALLCTDTIILGVSLRPVGKSGRTA